MPEDRQSRHFGKDLAEQLETLAGQSGRNTRQAREIASWLRETREETQARVSVPAGRHDNGYCAGGPLGGLGGHGTACHNDRNLEANQFLRQGRELLKSSAGKARFE